MMATWHIRDSLDISPFLRALARYTRMGRANIMVSPQAAPLNLWSELIKSNIYKEFIRVFKRLYRIIFKRKNNVYYCQKAVCLTSKQFQCLVNRWQRARRWRWCWSWGPGCDPGLATLSGRWGTGQRPWGCEEIETGKSEVMWSLLTNQIQVVRSGDMSSPITRQYSWSVLIKQSRPVLETYKMCDDHQRSVFLYSLSLDLSWPIRGHWPEEVHDEREHCHHLEEKKHLGCHCEYIKLVEVVE